MRKVAIFAIIAILSCSAICSLVWTPESVTSNSRAFVMELFEKVFDDNNEQMELVYGVGPNLVEYWTSRDRTSVFHASVLQTGSNEAPFVCLIVRKYILSTYHELKRFSITTTKSAARDICKLF